MGAATPERGAAPSSNCPDRWHPDTESTFQSTEGTEVNEHQDRGRPPSAVKMSTFASRVAGGGPAPTSRGPSMREMERPRTESYGELWRRANNRFSRN